MAKSSYQYRERDYTFGNYCVTLRTALGVTQSEMGRMLGVSERAIQTWEGGLSYPKVEHLKHFIELCVQHHVFSGERAPDEVRTLWKLARLKALFDEQWLQQLLNKYDDALYKTSSSGMLNEHTSSTTSSNSVLMMLPVSIATTSTHVDWGEAFDVSNFYGREDERAMLSRWIVEERCRVVGVFGMGGIGKTSLTITLMHEVVQDFQAVVWRSVRDAPACENLLGDIVQVLSPHPISDLPDGFHARLRLLIELFRTQRCLLVLDNMETLLQAQEQEGRYREGYEDYGRLVQQIGEMAHQSCLLLTSREKSAELIPMDGSTTPVRSLQLSGLNEDAGASILREKGLRGDAEARATLIASYSGNPLALKIVGESIRELFEGDIAAFLAENVLLFRGIRALLAQQFARLTPLEQQVMFWLATMREPVELSELVAAQAIPIRRLKLLESLETLRHHSLIERRQTSFIQQSVVLEYVTDVLVQRISEEIQRGDMKLLCSHALKQATAREYIRVRQEHMLILPVLADLRIVYTTDADIAAQLTRLLDQLREHSVSEQGYGPANIASLLYHLQGHLRDVDLSHLALRGVYLQGVEMQRASLNGAILQECNFTDYFNIVTEIATSETGTYWAAGFSTGEIRIWRTEGTILYFLSKAHTSIAALAFTADGRMLASGGRDHLIKVWDVENRTLIWTLSGHTSILQCVVFSPDGRMLAGSDADGMIRLWDMATGACLRVIEAQTSGSVFGLSWHPGGQLLASGDSDATIRFWDTSSGACIRTLSGHENWVVRVAFSPDGKRLASASWDGTVKLWDSESGICLQTLSGHSGSVATIAFSPDGTMLASGGSDTAIRLWNLTRGVTSMMLTGHKDTIQALTFIHNGATLLSGGYDGTIREWEVARGYGLQTIEGYRTTLLTVAYSPDGKSFASGGLDGTVTLWNAGASTMRLQGHSQTVCSVSWHPDGRRLASGSFDRTIRIWNTQTGICMQVLQGHTGALRSVAWNPGNEHLLASVADDNTLRVWDMLDASCRWMYGDMYTTVGTNIAWSPDGQFLACVKNDSSIALLRVEDRAIIRTLRNDYSSHSTVEALAWSPDGAYLLSGGGTYSEGEMAVWDVSNGHCVRTFAGLPALIEGLAWTPDGTHIVSSDYQKTKHVWNVKSGVSVASYHGTRGNAFDISPDGNTLISCGNDGITLWDVHTLTPQHILRLERPYEHLDITNVRGLTDAQRTSLLTLGAIDHVVA